LIGQTAVRIAAEDEQGVESLPGAPLQESCSCLVGAPCHTLSMSPGLITLLALAQVPASVSGVASVVDGDTIEIHGVRIRLHGVDTPESSQLCLDAKGQRFRCGALVANKLAAWLGRRTVTCSRRDTDRYRRMVAACTVGDESVNAWLVNQGYAAAYKRYSKDHIAAEEAARAERRGLWAGQWQMPWDYRSHRSSPPGSGAPRKAAPTSVYRSCEEARAAGAAPLHRGEPGYRPALDRDGDGLACESNR
jgi:endonuclease YncB( thermonuclease family)